MAHCVHRGELRKKRGFYSGQGDEKGVGRVAYWKSYPGQLII